MDGPKLRQTGLKARSHWKRIRNRKVDPRVLNHKAAGIERLGRVTANRFGADFSEPFSQTAKRQPIATRRLHDVGGFPNKMAPVASKAL